MFDAARHNMDVALPQDDLAAIAKPQSERAAINHEEFILLDMSVPDQFAFDPGQFQILAVGASNEWPSPETGKELSALFDRFLLRVVSHSHSKYKYKIKIM